MKIAIIDKAVKTLDEFIAKNTDTLPMPEDNSFIPIEIKKENFHELDLFSDNALLTGIDGGNAEILSGANFSLQFIRVVAVSYKDKKRVGMLKKEFFCFVKANTNNDKISYVLEFFGDTVFDKVISINSDICTLDGERYKLEAEAIGGIVRRYAELRLARIFLDECEERSFLVIDGSIKARYDDEFQLIRKLIDSAAQKETVVGFLSKSCRLLTKNAFTLSSALNELGPKSRWYYHPLFKINSKDFFGEIFFVKLHSKTDYVFKLEINRDAIDKASCYILALSMNANDPVFYGYPYCLVDADSQARVSYQEREYLKTIFLSRIKNKGRLRYILSSMNAHDVLDKIMY